MSNSIQMKSNGLHSGTIIQELLDGVKIHLHPETKEVVVVEETVVPDGGGCIAKEEDVIAVFRDRNAYEDFIKII